MLRTALSSVYRSSAIVSARQFSTSPISSKTTKEKVAEVADKVNKSLGKGLASAIETGEQATQVTKETVSSVKKKSVGNSEKVKDAAAQMAHKASSEASSTKEKAKDAVRK